MVLLKNKNKNWWYLFKLSYSLNFHNLFEKIININKNSLYHSNNNYDNKIYILAKKLSTFFLLKWSNKKWPIWTYNILTKFIQELVKFLNKYQYIVLYFNRNISYVSNLITLCMQRYKLS